MYAVFGGNYFTNGDFEAVFYLKQDAVRAIRVKGFKYNKEHDVYLNDNISKWYKIERCLHNKLSLNCSLGTNQPYPTKEKE